MFTDIEEEVRNQFMGGMLDDQLDDQIKALSESWKYTEVPIVRLYRDKASAQERREFEERKRAAATRMLQVSHEGFEAEVAGDQARFVQWERDEKARVEAAGAQARRFKEALRENGCGGALGEDHGLQDTAGSSGEGLPDKIQRTVTHKPNCHNLPSIAGTGARAGVRAPRADQPIHQ